MPNCPDCGVRSENGAPACSSCGLVFSPEPAAKGPELEASDDRPSVVYSDSKNRPPSMTQTYSTEEYSNYIIRDTQLGKGTIKPYSVELGIDGYHFKFEEPPRRMSKPESAKEKSAEFRVTEADNDRLAQAFAASFDKTYDAAPGNDQPDRVNEAESEPFINQKEPEEVSEQPQGTGITDQIIDSEARQRDTEPEVSTEPAALEIDIPETPELQSAESERVDEGTKALPPDEETLPIEAEGENPTEHLPDGKPEEATVKIVWKGNRSFLGIPFSEQYQVTSRSIIVDQPKSGRHYEYSLTAVVTLSVKQTWLDKILGTGDLAVKVRAGTDTMEVALKGIGDPMNVLRMVANLIGTSYNKNYG